MGWNPVEQGSSDISRCNGEVFEGNVELHGRNSIIITGYPKLEWRFEDETVEEKVRQHNKGK